MMSLSSFQQELSAHLERASKMGFLDILVNAGELHRSVGGVLGGTEDMPTCCAAMEAEMHARDIVLLERENGYGMTVRYVLPRALLFLGDRS
jgi:hypothetical protein